MSRPIVRIPAERVTATVVEMLEKAHFELGEDVKRAFRLALEREASPIGREVISQLLENIALAADERIPYCQDTGMALVWVEKGSHVVIEGGSLRDAINEGVRQAYTRHYFRKSVVQDPFMRRNTGDNTPAIIYLEESDRDDLKISIMPKGFGGEMMSRLEMLPPSEGWEGVKRVVVETVRRAGPNACPPVVVGVGVGGSFDYVAQLAKRALLRDVGEPNPEPRLAALEQELLEAVNATGIGPQGLGGTMTATAVHLEVYPTHIAALPVAVNLGCNAYRHRTAVIHGEADG